MRAELEDGRILEFPDGTDPAVIQQTVKKMLGEQSQEYDPFTIENIAGSAVEPLMTLGSGALAMPVAGLSGLGAMAAKGLGADVDPAEVVRKTQEAMTYQPRTGGGEIATGAISYPFEKFAEFAQEGAGQKVLEMTGSPEAATAVSTGLQALPMVFGAKYAPSGKPAFLPPAVESAIKFPVTFPASMARKGGGMVAEAIRNRLPGGAEKAVGTAVSEMLGPRKQAVVDALMQAKPGETAGQAAVPAGAYELSALQELARSRDPSKYGAISEAQQMARREQIGEIARTPEELTAAIKARSAKASPLYEAAREAQKPVDISPTVFIVDKLISENPGNTPLLTALKDVKKGLVDPEGNFRTNAKEILSTVDGLKTAIANKDNKFIKGELTNIKDSLIDSVPGYRQAQEVFREASVPINEMQVGKVLEDAISPRLGTEERAAVFANAIENAKQTVKKATGEPRFTKLDEVLQPEQVKTVKNVMSELNRDKTLKYQSGKGFKAMNEAMGTMFDIPKVTILERSIVIMNAILKKIEGKNTKLTMDLIAEKMSDPKEMARIIKEASPAEAKVLKQFKNQLLTGSAIGAAENE